MFSVLQVTTSRAAVLQHHSDVQCTAVLQHHSDVQYTAGHNISRCSTATSQRCSIYCRSQHLELQDCNITSMFNVLQVLQHHIDVQCTASIATSQRCSMYCKYCNITAMFNVLQVTTSRSAVLKHHSDVLCTADHNISSSSTAASQRCSMYCKSQHLAQQYCNVTAMFNVLQVTTSHAAVLQHHNYVLCTAGHISSSSIATSQRCSMYCGSQHLVQ